MQVKIRYAKTEDFSQLKDIWLRCFNDSKEFIDLFFSYKGYWKAIVIEHNNTIVSMLFVIPTADDFWYIYAVATLSLWVEASADNDVAQSSHCIAERMETLCCESTVPSCKIYHI